MTAPDPPAPKMSTSFAVVTVVVGFFMLVVARIMSLKDLETVGFLILGIGIPYLLFMVYLNFTNLRIVSLMMLMRKEKLLEISKNKERNKKLIQDRFESWAEKKENSVIKLKGVTLNLFFGNNGLLRDVVQEKKLVNPGGKTIQALVLNPYCMSAITRSIQESRPFAESALNPVEAICTQTLTKHKSDILYNDFCITVKNILDLQRSREENKLKIECRVYSTFSPSFLLIDDQRAISENLILGRKKNDPAGKLFGLLPHMTYGNGDIKECLENHFDYIWRYDSVSLEDFHESVEAKNYEVNRLFLLYSVQKDIWERVWEKMRRGQNNGSDQAGRSSNSPFDELYRVYNDELFPGYTPRRIIDLGCGDGGGGSLDMFRNYPDALFYFNDVSASAIQLCKENAQGIRSDCSNASWNQGDMLTFLNTCKPEWYSLIYANFSIIYMTKIKAIEIFRQIFRVLRDGGIFMLSVWTEHYFDMPVGKHGQPGHRPQHRFERIPMTENLQVLVEGNELRLGEIRRFYRDFDELMEEFQSADNEHLMDFDTVVDRYYENNAVLRVWLRKK